MKIFKEDNHIVVCYKERGILSQQDSSNDADLLRMVKSYIKEKYNKPGEVFIGLVHRLDRNTEGIMVFARTSKAASRLFKSMEQDEFEKEYLAVVHGSFESIGKKGTLRDYLLKNEKENKSCVNKNGKEAILDYEVLDIIENQGKPLTLLKIKLQTGRHHQIRVQLSSRGYPIYGDSKYGSLAKESYYALSNFYLSFPHPTLKEPISTYYFLPSGIFLKFYSGADFLNHYHLV